MTSSRSAAAEERRPHIIKASAAASVATRELVMNRFEASSVQIMRDPAVAAAAERQSGYDAGYQEGLAQARADVIAATEDSNRRVRRALAALSEAVTMFDQRQTVALGDVEDAIVAGAFALARTVLQRELITATDPGGDALARALQLIPDRGDVVARLHPDDAATLNMDRIAGSARTLQVVADPSIELGGCIVEVGELRIDAQLSSALEHVARAMNVDPAIVDTSEPLIDEDITTTRMEAAIAALQQASTVPSERKAIQADVPIQNETPGAVIEGTEAPVVEKTIGASTSKKATAGSGRKSSRKTASEAPSK